MAVTTTSHLRRRARALAAAALLTIGVGALAPTPTAALTPVQGNGAWVNHAYDVTLDRSPTGAQYQHWTGRLDGGTTRRQVADALVGSREHALRIVYRLYDRILGRSPEPGGAPYWRERLMAGERPTTMASFLYGSPELYEAAGGTATGYVTFLYRDVLGREPDPAGLAYWSARITAGENRTGLARAWLLTPEATELRAGLLFLDVLHRPPSAAERTDWGGRLRRFDERRITAALLATSEAYTLSQQYKPGIRLTAGNGLSRQPSISGGGRIIAFASTASNLTPGGSPAGEDIFVIDLRTGRTRAITAGNGASSAPEVSADGATVVFQSAATNLVAGDANGQVDIFEAPTSGGAITRLTNGNGASTEPTISGDGTVVAFTSVASDLVASDPNGATHDVFVRDATAVQPALERIPTSDGTFRPRLSADGGSVGLAVESVPGLEVSDVPGTVLYRLPLGPEPEPIVLGVGSTARPGVSDDGSRVAYLGYADVGGRPFAELWLGEIDGQEVTRTKLAGPYRIESSHISDDGSVVLATFFDENGHGDRLIRPGVPANPFPIALPIGGDLTRAGTFVVGSVNDQIVLYEPG